MVTGFLFILYPKTTPTLGLDAWHITLNYKDQFGDYKIDSIDGLGFDIKMWKFSILDIYWILKILYYL